jgi:hypothetical protein
LRHGVDGERSLGPARLDDYAALGLAQLSLYDATASRSPLATAEALADAAVGALWDAEEDGFYLHAQPHAPLPLRMKSGFDSERPSGNAVMALFLEGLAARSGRARDRNLAVRTVQAFAGDIETAPSGLESLMAAAVRLLPPSESPTTEAPPDPPAPARMAEGPLVLELRTARTSLRPGETTELYVRLQPASGFVVTPHSATGRGVVPLSVALLDADLIAGAAVYGPATLTGAYDGAMVPIRVPRSTPPGSRRVRVSVRAQACTAEGDCRAPLRATLSVAVNVSAP